MKTIKGGKFMMKTIKYCVIGLTVINLAGCSGGAKEFAVRPTPILCKQAQDFAPNYIYYDELIAELNKRGEDCAEYFRPGEKVDLEVRKR